MLIHTYHTPVGLLFLGASHGFLTHCLWQSFPTNDVAHDDDAANHDIILLACGQLDEYFAGKRKVFSVPLNPNQTPFRLQILQVMSEIPYGQTYSYADLAKAVGNPKALRATGTACRTNPLAIFIPCHRVVRASGAIGNYAGGQHAKEFLLNLEKQFSK